MIRSSHRGMSYYDTGGPSRQTFVLLHGLGSSANFWHTTVPVLAGQARTVAVDIPGFGRSTPPRPFTLDTVAQSIAALVNDLGIRDAVLVGHSLGGVVALRVAATAPMLFGRVVLTSATLGRAARVLRHPLTALRNPRFAAHVAGRIADVAVPITPRLARVLTRSARVRSAMFRSYAVDPARLDPDELAAALVGAGGRGFLRAVLAARSVDYLELLRCLPCPLDLVWGDSDGLIHDDDVAEAHAHARVARTLRIADCGHWPMLEHPGRFTGFLLESVETPQLRPDPRPGRTRASA